MIKITAVSVRQRVDEEPSSIGIRLVELFLRSKVQLHPLFCFLVSHKTPIFLLSWELVVIILAKQLASFRWSTLLTSARLFVLARSV